MADNVCSLIWYHPASPSATLGYFCYLNRVHFSQHEAFTHSVPSALTILSCSLYGAPGLVPPYSSFFPGGFLCSPYLHRPPSLEKHGGCHFNLFFVLISLFSVCNCVLSQCVIVYFFVRFPVYDLSPSRDTVLLEGGVQVDSIQHRTSFPRTDLALGGSLWTGVK